jgi:hypothetical protein
MSEVPCLCSWTIKQERDEERELVDNGLVHFMWTGRGGRGGRGGFGDSGGRGGRGGSGGRGGRGGNGGRGMSMAGTGKKMTFGDD